MWMQITSLQACSGQAVTDKQSDIRKTKKDRLGCAVCRECSSPPLRIKDREPRHFGIGANRSRRSMWLAFTPGQASAGLSARTGLR